ncbi:MAG: permease-like cell division protein FtsX [Oscillospiraceae bacterium]|nr:permease-like cell division protein FtsX [Oscillospiraceae bacterium]
MKRSFNLGYYIAEGFRSIFAHGLMSFAAVFMILACLLIMGSFSLVAVNLERELGELERDNQFLAFVDETYTREQALALQATLEHIPNVARVEFTAKEEAKENYAAQYAEDKNSSLYSELPDEVFRDRYAVFMEDLSLMSETIERVDAVEGIDGHQAAPEVAEGFLMVRNIAGAVAMILIVLLLIISLFIIYNTIKLGTFTRREEIAIMKMCGATNGFVRAPFIVEGILLGLAGAVLAFFCQWGVYELIGRTMDTGHTIELITIIPFRELARGLLAVFAATGLVVGTGGSVMAIRKFLQV